MELQYSYLSINLSKKICKEDKKKDGIFFTPNGIIRKNIELLDYYMEKINTILEPSCGSCEYIYALNKEYPSKKIVGIEYNDDIYNEISKISLNNVEITKGNYLKTEDNKYDLIIGNPPFYVMKKSEVETEYYDYFTGRPNIFVLFILKSLKKLNNNGILSFVLPVNFMNGLYYDKIRKYIARNYTILNLTIFKNNEDNIKFIDTTQETILLIIQNKPPSVDDNRYTKNIYQYTVYNDIENIEYLNGIYNSTTNLYNMGFNVKVGNIVWNKEKSILTDNDNETRLIYSSDIEENNLIMKDYKNEEKKNFIKMSGKNEPLIIVNRGYGNGSYTFNYCLLDVEKRYLIENHLLYIEYNGEINRDELLYEYKKIINSFNDPRTKEFIKIYFRNTAINSTELMYVMPIFMEYM